MKSKRSSIENTKQNLVAGAGTFGVLLRKYRKKARYSIKGLAGLIGITAGQLSAIERGQDAPLTEDQTRRAAVALDAPLKPLLAARAQDMEEAFKSQWPILKRK